MCKGFIRIPRRLLETKWWNQKQVFSENEAVVNLYQRADRQGIINSSIRSLAREWGWEQTKVLRFLTKLEKDKFISSTKLRNGTVIKILDFGEGATPTATPSATPTTTPNTLNTKDLGTNDATPTATPSATPTTTPSRAYKNDNIIKSCLIEEDKDKNKSSLRSDLQKNQSSPEDDVEQRFNEWMKNNFPFVSKMKRTLSLAQYNSLLDRGYTNEQVSSKLADMDNFAGIEKKYTNAHRTLLNWLKQDFGNKTKK